MSFGFPICLCPLVRFQFVYVFLLFQFVYVLWLFQFFMSFSCSSLFMSCCEINEDLIYLCNSGFNQLKSQATNMAAMSAQSVLFKCPLTALQAHDHKSPKLIQQRNNTSSRWGPINITFTPLLKIQSIGWASDPLRAAEGRLFHLALE